jgi:hypothetical protein
MHAYTHTNNHAFDFNHTHTCSNKLEEKAYPQSTQQVQRESRWVRNQVTVALLPVFEKRNIKK